MRIPILRIIVVCLLIVSVAIIAPVATGNYRFFLWFFWSAVVVLVVGAIVAVCALRSDTAAVFINSRTISWLNWKVYRRQSLHDIKHLHSR